MKTLIKIFLIFLIFQGWSQDSTIVKTVVKGKVFNVANTNFNEQSEKLLNKDIKHDKYITSSVTLSDANVEPIATPDLGKEVINFVSGSSTLTLNNSITKNKTFYLQPNKATDVITLKPSSSIIKFRGVGNIALDTTMSVKDLTVSNMDMLSITKVRDNTYSLAGNFTAALFLPYNNQSNPNPELVTNDAAGLETNNASTINRAAAVLGSVTVTAVNVANSGYDATHVRKVTADSPGTVRREAVDFTVLNATSYHATIIIRNTQGTLGRFRFVQGAVADNNTFASSTEWTKYEVDFTTNGTNLRFDVGPFAASCNTGDSVEYLLSIKRN